MRINSVLFGLLLLSIYSTTALAQSSNKEKVIACKNAKIAKLITESRESVPDVTFGAHCEPGSIRGLIPQCGGIENNTTPASITAKPGYRLITDSIRLVDNGGNTPSRTGFNITSQNERQVSAVAYCNGHGCGGQGAIDARARLMARQEYVPTLKDSDNAFEQCIDEVIGK